MEFIKNRPSLEEIRNWDMVTYLSVLGHEPSRIRGNNYWYLSPLRNENTASFKVERTLNRWYDHGEGIGGNLIDFAIRYHDCTIGELLTMLSGEKPFILPARIIPSESYVPERKIEILSDAALSSHALIAYLNERRIDLEVARQYCREVRYRIANRMYYAIGFSNNLGGFELRNPYSKLSSSPKGITTFLNRSAEAVVFEGFMDFLTFRTLHKHDPKSRFDFLVLNSLSFFERALPFMNKYTLNRLFLDRDSAGRKATAHALSLGDHFLDESHLYQNHKDLNEWAVNFGMPGGRSDEPKVS